MSEPWKVTTCNEEDCLKEALDERGNLKEEYKIYPDVDTEYMTQFTCSKCGHIETWGPTRLSVAKSLYERINNA